MSIRNILIVLIFLALLLERNIISLPLVFAISILGYILYPHTSVIVAAFFAGLILDVLGVNAVGTTPVVIILSFCAIEIIKMIFTFKDYRLVVLVSFFLTYIYALFFSYNTNLLIYAGFYVAGIGIFLYLSKSKLIW